MVRRILRALTANWQCSQCDTYNAPSDPVCIACGLG